MSVRYKIIFAYDGTRFAGFERQPHQRTVEGVITDVVNIMAKHPQPHIKIYGSGRTDAGVHAIAQVAHFDFPFRIPVEGMLKGINSLLPLDIEVKRVAIVPKTFHARYDVVGKSYVYRVYLGHFIDPFKRFYTGHWRIPLDVSRIKIALRDLLGEHDFTSFVASGSEAKSNVRTIYNATCYLNQSANELRFRFCGNGFLYNMVRIMVGVLLEIGSKRRPIHDILRLYLVKDRTQAIYTASPQGLYLQHVYYPQDSTPRDLKY